jgi:homocysteine S-methyltransferase
VLPLAVSRGGSRIRDPIAEILRAQPVIVLDGALATELERRGADLDDPLWSAKVLLEQPALIRAVHRDYFDAGADVATSVSYQASFQGFARRGIDAARAAELMRLSVTLAIEARDEFLRSPQAQRRARPLIAASVGPYGAALADGSEYRGGYARSDEDLTAFHRPRLAVLASAGADLLACETVPSLREALLLARLIAEFPATCAWISFSCRDAEHTGEGQPIGECVQALAAYPQIVSVGVNCTSPAFIVPLLRRMRHRTARPLLVYPNSGETYDATTRSWRGDLHQAPLTAQACAWHAEGARLIGGCCRTTPADIHAMRSGLAQCA